MAHSICGWTYGWPVKQCGPSLCASLSTLQMSIAHIIKLYANILFTSTYHRYWHRTATAMPLPWQSVGPPGNDKAIERFSVVGVMWYQFPSVLLTLSVGWWLDDRKGGRPVENVCRLLSTGLLRNSKWRRKAKGNQLTRCTERMRPVAVISALNYHLHCFVSVGWMSVITRGAPIIGRWLAVLPIINIGRLLQQYRLIVIYTHNSDNTCRSKWPFIEWPPVLSDYFYLNEWVVTQSRFCCNS